MLKCVLPLFFLIISAGCSPPTHTPQENNPSGFYILDKDRTVQNLTDVLAADVDRRAAEIEARNRVNNLDVELVINDNGNYSVSLKSPNRPTINLSGTWRMNGDKVLFKQAGNDSKHVPVFHKNGQLIIEGGSFSIVLKKE